ncbi:Replication protein A 70 kDa DNA-binding subunit B [Bienertia sinuspersici]
MKGVLFDRDIDLFRETLVEGKEYDITNPIIARIPEMFKRTEQVYQMTINAATQISETQSAVELPSYLIPLTKVGDYIGKNERIDIIGIAVHMHDKAIVRAKSSGIPYEVRKVEMLDTEMQVIQLSIWNTLVTTEAEQIAQIIDTLPILEISRVTATTYNGASFNTSFASTIKINPDSPTAQLLHDWRRKREEDGGGMMVVIGGKRSGNVPLLASITNATRRSHAVENITLCLINLLPLLASYSGEIWRNRGWGTYASDSFCGGSESGVVKSINEIEKSPEKIDDSKSTTKSVPVEKISEKDEKEKLEKMLKKKKMIILG